VQLLSQNQSSLIKIMCQTYLLLVEAKDSTCCTRVGARLVKQLKIGEIKRSYDKV